MGRILAAFRALKLAVLIVRTLVIARRCELCGATIPDNGAIAVCGRCIAERS